MIEINMPLNKDLWVACSGGVDSMAVLSFLMRRKTKPKVAYMNHGTAHGAEAESFVRSFCQDSNLELTVGNITSEKSPKESSEEYWRNQRYLFLHSLPGQVVSGHHLDDAVEQWLFSSIHGKPGVMPIRNKNVCRPFMTTTKQQMTDWCVRHSVPWIQDPSNSDEHYARNIIRHSMMPAVLKVNPGIHKVVKKIVKAQYDSQKSSA